ncbi:cysteine--tRNA ligase [Spiroplasma chrysopicola]|uniref:Cysteine--tRNA ligase n=1 Tax=Spiroplasma chrysopicola DF-1 TaxID=1276227 RepID=R4U0G4_9MOLU|nr:cysteine--tRNA ligase [Spiroplasma chrysopicola]AGM24732.1 cysteinyl-tRNA synthetase [Spiroplasma chrysopicola DF-1]
MKVYNTLTRKNEEINQTKFNIYACGPTVYNYIHLGNARALINADLLVNVLEFQQYEVNYIQNYTDIDDKIINKALAENKTEAEISAFYIDAFEKDVTALNIRKPNKMLAISNYIDDIIAFIADLMARGAAYESNGNVYFAIDQFLLEYGKLGNKTIAELNPGERVEADSNKRNVNDFTLWKKTIVGILFDSPWGQGRPGWHTECALLIDKFFSHQTIDFHLGGIDLVFPHHENERIQYLAKNNCEITKIWLHNGHLNLEEQKMSKSLGNTILVRDFIAKYDPATLRYLFYSTNFSQPLNVTQTVIAFAQKETAKIFNILKTINLFLATNDLKCDLSIKGEFVGKALEQLNNNLNTPNVLSIINDMIKIINQQLRNNKIDLTIVGDFYNIIFNLLNFSFTLPVITPEIKGLIQEWQHAKAVQDFVKADKIRTQLVEKNIL